MDVVNVLLVPIALFATGLLTQWFGDMLFKIHAVIDGLPAGGKRLVIPVIAAFLTWAYSTLGLVDLPTDFMGLTGENAATIISSAIAFVFHHADKAKEPTT